MKHHPYAEIWPLFVEGPDYEKFREDIRVNGQRVPILLYQGMIIDGRTREWACDELGIAPRCEDAPVKSDQEALDLVISLNQHRRHMSVEQRAFAASRLANLKKGDVRSQFVKIKQSDTSNEVSQVDTRMVTLEKAAKALDVPRMSVERARAVLKHTPELEEGVQKGTMSLAAAAKQAWAKASNKPRAKPDKPPPRPIEPARMAEFLTREQIDPEFQGTDFEFTSKYGLSTTRTAERLATDKFTHFVLTMRSTAKCAKKLLDMDKGLPHDMTVDRNWLRKPKQEDIARLVWALEILRPLMTEAEELLEIAQAAKQKAA